MTLRKNGQWNEKFVLRWHPVLGIAVGDVARAYPWLVLPRPRYKVTVGRKVELLTGDQVRTRDLWAQVESVPEYRRGDEARSWKSPSLHPPLAPRARPFR